MRLKGIYAHALPVIVRLRYALYGLKQAQRLWHNNITAFIVIVRSTPSHADCNRYIWSDGILILLSNDDISMIYSGMESATNAAIEVKVNLSEKSKISNLGVARPFLGIEIHRDSNGTGISLGQKTFISMIVKLFHMHHTHRVTTPMVPNLKLDLDDDRCNGRGQAQVIWMLRN